MAAPRVLIRLSAGGLDRGFTGSSVRRPKNYYNNNRNTLLASPAPARRDRAAAMRKADNSRRFPQQRPAVAGFSLLELLVVVVIIAILAGVAVLSLGTLGSDREVQREAERLRSLVGLLTEEAIMESRDYGILFSESAYRFYVYDYQTLTWQLPVGDRLLAEHELTPPLQLDLALDEREVRLSGDFQTMDINEQPQPQVVLFATGEVTPFAAGFFREINGGRFLIDVQFDGSNELTQDGFDAP